MPAASTHVEFARDVYNHLPQEIRLSIHSMNLYFLGSQGPDFLFYHRFGSLPGTLKPLGNHMHDYHAKDVILFLKNYTADKDPSLKDYYLGFLTHYCLDSTCHPLINYEAHNRHEADGQNESAAHVRIEAELDAQVLKKYGKSAADYDVYRYLTTTEEEKKKLAWMWHLCFLAVYHKDVDPSLIRQAAADTPIMLGLLKPSNGKYDLAFHVENMLKAPHGISGLIIAKTQVPSILDQFWVMYDRSREKALRVMTIDPDPKEFDLNFVGIYEKESN